MNVSVLFCLVGLRACGARLRRAFATDGLDTDDDARG